MTQTTNIPPQAVELEEAVLGGLLLESSEYAHTVTLILKVDSFYLEQNKIVYRAIMELYNESKPIDILTVVQKIKQFNLLDEVGGAIYVSKLTNKIASAANIEYHARVIQQNYILRELIKIGSQLSQNAYLPNTDCFKLIDQTNKKISDLTSFITSSVKRIDAVFSEMVTEQSNVIEKGLPTGLLTGFKNIDDVTGGWQKGNLIILAARPGMGKTALALEFAKYPAISLNKPVAIFSMEMTAIELVGRMASSESNVSSTKITQKKLNRAELQTMASGCTKLISSPIFIDDTSGLTYGQLKSKANKLKHEHGIELIIIDYLQLMSGSGEGNREQEISTISRNLKILAKDLEVPVIALSQLSRKCEERSDKRPQLSDLRDSGAIEQDADMVAFIWRPEYYGLCDNGYEYGADVLQTRDLAMLDFAKGRGIKIGEVPLRFYGEFTKFDNYDLRPTIQSNPVDYTEPLKENNEFLNS
jgi:replicative DNA helicase